MAQVRERCDNSVVMSKACPTATSNDSDVIPYSWIDSGQRLVTERSALELVLGIDRIIVAVDSHELTLQQAGTLLQLLRKNQLVYEWPDGELVELVSHADVIAQGTKLISQAEQVYEWSEVVEGLGRIKLTKLAS